MQIVLKCVSQLVGSASPTVLWLPPRVVLVLGGTAGQDLLGGHREKGLRSPSRARLLEQLSVLFGLAASSSPSRKN